MKKLQIVTRVFHKTLFQIRKHSPEILITAGVVGVVGGTVMACKATLKARDTIQEAKKDISEIREKTENGCTAMGAPYSEEEGRKELTSAYAHAGLQLAKIYTPSVVVITTALGCVVASNNMLRKRNVALAAAYATIDKSFKEYRSRVVDRFGEAVDRQLKYDIQTKEVEETIVDENGKEKKVKKTVEVSGKNPWSDYSRFFDVGNPYWEKNAEYNRMFIRAQQQYANDKLRAQGFLFLNDVYESLGFEKTIAGQMVGWLYKPDDPNHKGDNYVDFGIFDLHRSDARNFQDAFERTVILDFNVDGPILNDVDLERV